MATGHKRNITFATWADASKKEPFKRVKATKRLDALTAAKLVHAFGDTLTAVRVDRIGTPKTPKRDGTPTHLRLYALHDEANRPLNYAPGEEPVAIDIAAGRYTAFVVHVVMWPDRIVGFDRHANAPGLTRLSAYYRDQADAKVLFRPLYDPSVKQRLEELDGVRDVEYGVHDPHKAAALRGNGMVGDLIPAVFGDLVPSMKVKLGMGRRSKRDAYLDGEVTDNVLQVAEAAEGFFDSLIISGKSKTERTAAGKPKTIRLNLLSQRLQRERELRRDTTNPSVPKPEVAYRHIAAVRRDLESGDDVLAAAVEARLHLDSL